MLIFLDSNIICANFYMNGPSFEVAQKVGTIILGQIVVDEVCNKFKERLEDQVGKAKNAIQEIRKLLPSSTILFDEINITDECRKYADYLEMFIIENGLTVAENYPSTKHELIVQRALQRKKPFKSDGSTGYRDYLVWLTCLDVAKCYASEEIHFITSNTHDFADSGNKEKLHPDLLADLIEMNIPERRFYYWNSLKSFVDTYAKQKLDILEANEALRSEIERNETGFLVPIQEYINTKLIGCRISGFDLVIPGNNEMLKELILDSGPQIDEITELDSERLLLCITIDSIGVVTSFLDETKIKEIEEFELDVIILDKNANTCTLQTTLGLRIQLRAVYCKYSKSITSVEVYDIDDYNCPYCPY